MSLLDVSIVNVALPSIEGGLGLDEAGLQWVVSGYALAFGLLLVPAGRLGDARGRRGMFVAGLALFTGASALAGLAPGPGWLIAARLLQGAGAGIINPQVSGLIQQLYRPEERGRPFGLLGAVIGVSTAVGPLLGGALIAGFGAEAGWRWVFFINLPIGVAAIVLGWRWIPAGEPARRREPLDPVGVALLGAAVLLLLLPLVQERQWTSPAKWLLVPAGLAVFAVFAAWERRYGRTRAPLVDLALFRRRSYALGSLLALCYFAGFTAIFFVLTIYLQTGLGYSALLAGLAVTPFAAGSAVASAAGGRLVNAHGRRLVAAGLATVLAGLAGTVLALHLAPGRGAGWAMALPLLVAGLGSGLVISPNVTLTLAEVPVERAGSAGGVLQTGQRIGTAVGIAGVGAVFFNRLAASGGDWSAAVRPALLVTVGFVAVALAAAVADIRADRRAQDRAAGEPVGAGTPH
ncbi:MFS transporter [Spirilliplanes yamanashiensis]|nr:MFS transporter [Spirilliplanes yamanashiensis]